MMQRLEGSNCRIIVFEMLSLMDILVAGQVGQDGPTKIHELEEPQHWDMWNLKDDNIVRNKYSMCCFQFLPESNFGGTIHALETKAGENTMGLRQLDKLSG